MEQEICVNLGIIVPFESRVIDVNLFQRGGFFQDGQEPLGALVRELQMAATELEEEGIELQGGDDRYQVPK